MSTKMTAMARKKKIGKIEDAKRAIFVTVTPLDVERGVRFAPDQCALAKASCRSLPNVMKTFFYKNAVYIATRNAKTKKEKTLRYIPSPEASKNIAAFDIAKKFIPGTYRLDVPSGSKTLKNIDKRSKKRKGRHMPGKKIIKRAIRATIRGRLQYANAY